MTTYTETSLKTRSEKITLVTIESAQKIKTFAASGADWVKTMPHFVVGVKDGETVLVKDTDWTFTPDTLGLKIIGGINPKARNLSVIYRHFYSTTPINLPYDLNNGEVVHWEERVNSIGQIGQQLDDENTGIVLESQSSIDLINTDGFFDSIFDTLIWENQVVKFYSWFINLPITEARLLFEGVIESKDFNPNRISFKIKDMVFKLKNFVNLGVFSETDGRILPSLLGKPKRRIYGEADFVKCASLDAILDGHPLTGTIAGSIATSIVTGTGTFFLDETSPSDKIIFTVNGEEYDLAIKSVDSNTQITLDSTLTTTIPSGTIAICKATVPFRRMNRTWHIAGHKLRAAQATIQLVQSPTIFLVDDVSDFEVGDKITIIDQQTTIRNISGNKIVTRTTISPAPVIGDVIFKRTLKDAYLGTRRMVYDRDYTLTNFTEAKLNIDSRAEFNLAPIRVSGITFTFNHLNRTFSTTANVDLRSFLKTRDWIKIDDVTLDNWYEVLSVDQQTIVVRLGIDTGGGSISRGMLYKNVEVIDESSLVTVSCLGKELDNKWLKTASDAVKDLIQNDALFDNINEESFTKAKLDCDYKLSMVIPENLGDKPPLIRDVLTKINESVFGSVYGDSSNAISFSILNSDKPENQDTIKDDDIKDFTTKTSQKIINNVVINYAPFVDIYSEQPTFKRIERASVFVNEMIGIKNTQERTLYIYNEDDAIEMAERINLFNSLCSTTINLKGKLNLAQYGINDKLYLDLERLYSRYGGLDRRKIGTVSGIKRDGYNIELQIVDLGNIYNRTPSIAPDEIEDYATSNFDAKIKWGYILDDDTDTPDPTNEEGLGNFLIG